ncbi:hypothetical protein BaRGS_00000541, partial [Batillaria attramentaria]
EQIPEGVQKAGTIDAETDRKQKTTRGLGKFIVTGFWATEGLLAHSGFCHHANMAAERLVTSLLPWRARLQDERFCQAPGDDGQGEGAGTLEYTPGACGYDWAVTGTFTQGRAQGSGVDFILASFLPASAKGSTAGPADLVIDSIFDREYYTTDVLTGNADLGSGVLCAKPFC